MENENYIAMFYKDLIKYNIKRIKHKIFIDDLSILNECNPFDIEDIRNVYKNKNMTKSTLTNDLITMVSANIFMGLERDYPKWDYYNMLVSCLDVDDEEEKYIKPLVNNIADDISSIKDIIQERMNIYKINNDYVALDKLFLINNTSQILGAFIAFEEDIKYE